LLIDIHTRRADQDVNATENTGKMLVALGFNLKKRLIHFNLIFNTINQICKLLSPNFIRFIKKYSLLSENKQKQI